MRLITERPFFLWARMTIWTRDEGIHLCEELYKITPDFGLFPALTGGLLYKGLDKRKDCDIILYRHRQMKADLTGLGKVIFKKLEITDPKGRELWRRNDAEWCTKARVNAKPIDFLLPDFGGIYTEEQT